MVNIMQHYTMNSKDEEYAISETYLLCSFTIIAIKNIYDTKYEKYYKDNMIWYNLQNIALYTSDIAKLLWGSNSKNSNDRKKVREILNVTDDFYINRFENENLRDLRNSLEHIDEGLIKFNRRQHIMVEKQVIGNLYQTIKVGDKVFTPTKDETLRVYDPHKHEFFIFGYSFNLDKILDDVVKINNNAVQWLSDNNIPYLVTA